MYLNFDSLLGIKTLCFQIYLKGFTISKNFISQLVKPLLQWTELHLCFKSEFIISSQQNFIFKFASNCSSSGHQMQTKWYLSCFLIMINQSSSDCLIDIIWISYHFLVKLTLINQIFCLKDLDYSQILLKVIIVMNSFLSF